MNETRGAGLAGFLRPGPEQRRLLDAMAAGHARRRHGRELGNLTAEQFKARVAAHLATAPTVYAIDSDRSRRRYLIVDAGTNYVAWIPPHKQHRATFFRPPDGAANYAASKQRLSRGELWTSVDIAAVRGDHFRQPVRAITSAGRYRRGPEHER